MMLVNTLQKIVLAQNGKNELWTRTLLKEPIQDYILNFIYNHPEYKRFIFTGGTALRKLYNLPRLSEDIDFDLRKPVDPAIFAKELKQYIAETLSYKNVLTKISGKGQTVFLKFPTLLSEVGFAKENDSSQLIVRCDFSVETVGYYQTEIRPVNIGDMAFFVEAYDLPTLFANKIIAFSNRTFFRGKTQTVSFKGRDLFDLVWLFEQSARSNYSLTPRWERVCQGLKIKDSKEILEQILAKVRRINSRDVAYDLSSFLAPEAVSGFKENYQQTLETQLANFINHLTPSVRS